MREIEDDVVIWYRPRVRVWMDQKGELHVGGEPDGFQKLLGALRLVARGLEDEAAVELRTDPIANGRNPVGDRGVKQMFSRVTLRHERGSSPLRFSAAGNDLVLSFDEQSKSVLGFALVEAHDGEGDFQVAIAINGAPSRLWFWGYSNPHGVNTF